jgi:hypothetical protein
LGCADQDVVADWHSSMLVRAGDVLEVQSSRISFGPAATATLDPHPSWTLVQNLATSNIGWVPTAILSQTDPKTPL